MNDNQWLQELKAGDSVVVSGAGWHDVQEIEKVERVTKTQIILAGDQRYRKDDGHKVGGSAWRRGWLSQATPELVAQVQADELNRRLTVRMEDTKWKQVSLSKKERIAAILDEPEVEVKAIFGEVE